MAIFKIAKNQEDNCSAESECIYSSEQDLRNLLFYGYKKSQSTVMGRLYPLGIECIYHQFLYLQWRRVKEVRTRALHYILSFDTQGYEEDIDCSAICGIMSVLSVCCFNEYQNIMFLHTDTPSHYHIHMVINPVNICTLKLYEKNFWQTGWEIAGWLETYNIPLQSFTKRNYKGNIVNGNETGAFVYEDKYKRKYNLSDGVFI